MKAKLDLVGQAFGAAASIWQSALSQLEKGGDFWSQMGQAGDTATAKLNIMRNATDDLIKSTELLRSANVLTSNNINMTTEEMEALGRAAVFQARATGQSADSLLRMFTDAISSGRVSALNKFGFQLETTGDLADKQTRVIDALTSKYKDMEVQAGDTAEAMAKTKNSLEVENLLATKNADWLGQWYARRKKEIKESAFATDSLIGRFKQQRDLLADQSRILKAAKDLTIERNGLEHRYSLLAALDQDNLDNRLRKLGELNNNQAKIVKKMADAALVQKALILNRKKAGVSTDKQVARLKEINAELTEEKRRLKEIQAQQKNINDEIAAAEAAIKGRFNAFLDGINAQRKAAEQAAKARQRAAQAAWKAEQAAKKVYEDQLKILNKRAEIYEEEGQAIPAIIAVEKQRLESILGMSKLERERFMLYEKAEKQNVDATRSAAEAKQKAIDDEYAAKKAQWDNEIAVTKEIEEMEKKIAEERKAAAEKVAEAEKQVIEARKKKIKGYLDSAPYKAFESAAVGAMTNVSKAIFMTDAELEKSGKTRSQILEKQLFEWLRSTGSQLIGDGTKNILMGGAKALFGDPTGLAIAGIGAAELGAGIAMGGIGSYGLSGMDSGDSGAATGTAAAASTTPTSAAEAVTNITYNISNSAVAGSLDPLIGTLDQARQQKQERGA